jgi:hypothetical protein
MNLRTVAVIIGVCLPGLSGTTARAQQQARSVNPEAIDFDLPGFARSEETRFRLDVFNASSDTRRDSPLKSSGVMSRNVTGGVEKVRVDLVGLLNRVPDGEYVATLLATRRGESIQSEPSPVFVLSRNPATKDILVGSRERFWTKVGLSISAGLLLVPFLFR